MRGVIYARYSSDAQREESIDAQIRENKVFAERHGIEIVGTYIDRALSAKTDNRPEFQRMIKDSAKKSFEVVIVWKLDPNKLEHRRQLINSFVNAVILYDDHFTFVGNYKDGTKTVTFAELEAAGLGSGFTASCVPRVTNPNFLPVGEGFGFVVYFTYSP